MMIGLGVIRDLVAIFGVIAGLSYYVITVQSQKKNQKLSAAYNVLEVYRDPKEYARWDDMMRWKWTSVKDFYDKYGDQESQSKWITMAQYYDGIGFLWDKGVIDMEVTPLFDAGYLILWRKYKPIIMNMRETWYSDWCMYWEKLADALDKKIGDKIPPRYSEGWN